MQLSPILDSSSAHQRRAIAKAITLMESSHPAHRQEADNLLIQLLPHSGNSFRLGVSGVPGVGKSTFIEALGLYLIGKGHRIAVLAIDPSSSVSGGSILADKTRMERLSVHAQAFVRPSPGGATLGGVASHTRETIVLLEAAGYDIVIVETVGVGQNEVAVSGMTDMFALLHLPNAGDELQAIKRGVMELADLVLINKADLDAAAAARAQAQIASSLGMLGLRGTPGKSGQWAPRCMQLCALQHQGMELFWQHCLDFQSAQRQSGQFARRRQSQAISWMWAQVEEGLRAGFRANVRVKAVLEKILADVEAGTLAASTAARQLLALSSNQFE